MDEQVKEDIAKKRDMLLYEWKKMKRFIHDDGKCVECGLEKHKGDKTIHVHNVTENVSDTEKIDPIKDLRTLCFRCYQNLYMKKIALIRHPEYIQEVNKDVVDEIMAIKWKE